MTGANWAATAGLLEIGWTLFALVWLPLCAVVIGDAWGDLREVGEPRPEDLVILAWRDLLIDGIGLYLLLLFAAIGFRAMSLPPAEGTTGTDPGSIALAVGLLIAEGCIGVGTGGLYFARQRVKALNRRAVVWERINAERRAAMVTALDGYVGGLLSAEEALGVMLDARAKAEALRTEADL